jgi:hypothetical protein
LNDNRSVYRSQLLLDAGQRRAQREPGGMYQDAGMFDVSVREAGRAVSADYANYSAHLFLANSYDQLRDPDWSNLRYETPAVAEFWIANLLAPTGAGWLRVSTRCSLRTGRSPMNRQAPAMPRSILRVSTARHSPSLIYLLIEKW